MSGLNYARSQRKGPSSASSASSASSKRPQHVDLNLPGHGTTTDQLHSILAQRERTADLESKMSRLFKRGKDGKEKSLMAAQAKIWAAESVKLHKDRLIAERELKEAMEGVSALLATAPDNDTTIPQSSTIDDMAVASDIQFRLAAESVIEELHEDRSVCRALSEGMLGSVFNVRAAVSMLRRDRSDKRVKGIVAEMQRTKSVVEDEMAEWNTEEAITTAGNKHDQLYKVLAQLQGDDSLHHGATTGGDGGVVVPLHALVGPLPGASGGSSVASSTHRGMAPSSSSSIAPLLAAQRAVSTLAQLDTHITEQLSGFKSKFPRAYADEDLVAMFKSAIQEICMAARSDAADVGEGGGGGGMDESVAYEDDFEELDDINEGDDDMPTPNNTTTTTPSDTTATNRLTAASLSATAPRGAGGGGMVPPSQGAPSTVASTSLKSRTSQVTFASVDDATFARVEEIVKSFKSVTKESTTTSSNAGGKGLSVRGGGISGASGKVGLMTPQQASRNRELLHHRIKLEFPALSKGQIIAICRAIGDGVAEGRRVSSHVRIAAKEVQRLLGAFKDALEAQEGYLHLEGERSAWREADRQRQAEQTSLLESLRAEKNERDAAALEVQLAEEAKKAAAQEQKDRVRDSEFQARVAKLIEYQDEKRILAEEEEVNRKAEEAILAEEKRRQQENNQNRVMARDAKDQERLDVIRLRNLEIEQEKAAHEHAMEKFFTNIQVKMGVQRDFGRVVQSTASSSAEGNQDLIPAREAAGRAHRQHGYTDDDILRDPRFRIHQALVAAGLQRTSYARTLVEKGCGYRMSNYNAMSEANPFS